MESRDRKKYFPFSNDPANLYVLVSPLKVQCAVQRFLLIE